MEENKKPTNKTINKPVKIDDGVSIKVKSNFYGKLYFRNPRSGDEFNWSQNGDIQFLTMFDLKTMKAQASGFFKNQWVTILGVSDDSDCKATPADICKALAIDIYYKNFIDPTNFDVVCSWSEAEIAEKISLLSDGAKTNLIVALNSFIENGTLDSRRKIKAFEKALDCELKNN